MSNIGKYWQKVKDKENRKTLMKASVDAKVRGDVARMVAKGESKARIKHGTDTTSASRKDMGRATKDIKRADARRKAVDGVAKQESTFERKRKN